MITMALSSMPRLAQCARHSTARSRGTGRLVAAAVAQPPRNKQTRTNRFIAGTITNRGAGVKDGAQPFMFE
jgi:hypothetical protein